MTTQRLRLGRHAARVQSALEQLQRDRVVARIWDRDASIWSADPKVQADIRNRLGWLRMPDAMMSQAPSFAAIARDVRQAGCTHALLLGMGGSGLYPEVCRHLFGVGPDGLDLALLDSTDPAAVRLAQARCPLSKLLVLISSKSGTTSETSALLRYFYGAFEAAGLEAGAHCIAITDEGTPLAEQARRLKFRRLIAHGPDSGADVGGRFSAVVGFGLLPAALLGADLPRLLRSEQEMLRQCGPSIPASENPAAQLAAVLGILAQEGRDKMTLLVSPALASFGAWAEQLVAESTGKLGKGIAPILGEPLRELNAYGQDRVFVELQLAGRPDAALERHAAALMEAGHPVVQIHWNDAYDLGGEVIKWSVATSLTGVLLGINPFDEPNVKESKDLTQALLQRFIQDGRLPEEPPACADARAAVFGALPQKPASPAEALRGLFQQLRPGECVTLLSFLPRLPELDRALAEMRRLLAERTPHATMLGIGPRYLHSTGQLFKGGPDAGIFLLFTGESGEDLPIPGEPFTFGILKSAQALGDFQAMRQKRRRILRLHLRGNLEEALRSCLGVIDEAAASVPRR